MNHNLWFISAHKKFHLKPNLENKSSKSNFGNARISTNEFQFSASLASYNKSDKHRNWCEEGFQIDNLQEVISANQIINLKTSESVGVTFPETDEENRSVLDRSRDGSLRKKESMSQSV